MRSSDLCRVICKVGHGVLRVVGTEGKSKEATDLDKKPSRVFGRSKPEDAQLAALCRQRDATIRSRLIITVAPRRPPGIE